MVDPAQIDHQHRNALARLAAHRQLARPLGLQVLARAALGVGAQCAHVQETPDALVAALGGQAAG